MTNGLTAAELAQMQNDIEQLFPDTCHILEVTYTSDGAGGMTEVWGTATAGISIPCRIDYLSGKEAITSGALNPYHKAIINMAHDVTITPANRIQIGSNVFSVQSGNAGQSWKANTSLSVELIP
jgi:head-tail adaptor